jgi:UDP-N-acetylglucosamine/UDP-N-acetylgalactosamine diphosphorylase
MDDGDLTQRLQRLSQRGVTLVDPRQVFIDADVDLDRVYPGAILYPGVRLAGRGTMIGPGAKIGSEGPATVINSAIAEGAEICGGFVSDSVLLDRAKIGSNGHIRGGCLLEEEASTAHTVGLKQTILMSFVTLGSLINCCDCLVSGGTSRRDHTEIGSGFIHFNFTPWGRNGDKATASLIGDVPLGVFLREQRIFIGGLSGLVGPHRVGFGTFSIAGQVIRSDIGAGSIYSEVPRKVNKTWNSSGLDSIEPRLGKNLDYIGNLFALRAWYTDVRKANLSEQQKASHQGAALDAAIVLIDGNIRERVVRLDEFLAARQARLPSIAVETIPPPTLRGATAATDHVSWVRSLSESEVQAGAHWLSTIVDRVVRQKVDVVAIQS